MGNYTSRCFVDYSNHRTAKLIDYQGNLRQVMVPVKAGELMIEEPGHVVSRVEELRRTRRIVAMRADDELLAGVAYLLISSGRVHGKVTEVDMAIVDSASSKKRLRNKRTGAKVLPAVAEEGEGEVEVLEESGCRVGNSRPWNPVLETIPEVF